MSTVNVNETLALRLNRASPQDLPDALRLVALGDHLNTQDLDIAVNPASATVVLPSVAHTIESVAVKASGTANSLGYYVVGDSDATPGIPPNPGGPGGLVGVGTDRKTLTFPNTVTRVRVKYTQACSPGSNLAGNPGTQSPNQSATSMVANTTPAIPTQAGM